MNTAPLESSFRLQGTPRMGCINIPMKIKCGRGSWHTAPLQGALLPSPAPSRATSSSSHCGDSQGNPKADGTRTPLGFVAPNSRDSSQRRELQLLEGHMGGCCSTSAPRDSGMPSREANTTSQFFHQMSPARKRISLLVLCRADIFWMFQCKFY